MNNVSTAKLTLTTIGAGSWDNQDNYDYLDVSVDHKTLKGKTDLLPRKNYLQLNPVSRIHIYRGEYYAMKIHYLGTHFMSSVT